MSRPCIARETPSTPCFIRSSPHTWRPSCARWRRPATAWACRSSSSASSGSFCCAACSRPAWRGFSATAAGASTCCRSCKGRAWCPSCGGRRMTERAAHLVDAVLPWVPVRQWVLTVPYRLRYQMAWNHGLSRAVLRVYTRVLLDVYARDARARGVPGGRTGSVTVMQRAGSGLNVNLHFHTLVLDGVFTEERGGALAFHPAPGPSDAEV
ncbi:MAG: transposase zinc-binding domain-containing protein, partial [Candidatus Rokubacteria bacterium]|nr:transposase zinc-binding domain-containing protein [Candidatus Rokubacteria bacterium]